MIEISAKQLNPNEIAVLILSTQAKQYKQFQQAIRNTWMKKLTNAGVYVYFYSGGHIENRIIGDEIQLATPDKLKATSEKLKAAIETLCKAHPQIKLIYRTNLSSYIEISNFFMFIKENRLNTKSYLGIKGKAMYLSEYFYGNRILHMLFKAFRVGPIITFASGSGFFLGIDYARKLIGLRKYNELIDDVMVARALKITPDQKITPERFDIVANGKHRISLSDYLELVNNRFLFHYRFKTKDRQRDAFMLELFDNQEAREKECTISK